MCVTIEGWSVGRQTDRQTQLPTNSLYPIIARQHTQGKTLWHSVANEASKVTEFSHESGMTPRQSVKPQLVVTYTSGRCQVNHPLH